MRLPSLFRRTPFRLTLLFLALFATAAAAVLAWVYVASANEARLRAEEAVRTEVTTLTGIYEARGLDALNMAVIDRTLTRDNFLYLLIDAEGNRVTGSLNVSPIQTMRAGRSGTPFP